MQEHGITYTCTPEQRNGSITKDEIVEERFPPEKTNVLILIYDL